MIRHTFLIDSEVEKQVINVTSQVQSAVSGFSTGLVLVSVPHTTAALFIAEDDEELRDDYIKVAEKWLSGLKPFRHIRNNNPNTEAHVLSSALGTNVVIALDDGELDLGAYQNIMFIELDGPKRRRAVVNVLVDNDCADNREH